MRLASIQRLRAIAALLVVTVHAFDLADQLPDAALERFWLINDFGASGVDLFFVLSGFVMTLGLARFGGPGGARNFLIARAIRILPLFWLLNLAFILLLQTSPQTGSIVSAIALLPLADNRHFSLPPLWVGWTLAFEAIFYAMVAIASRTARPVLILLALVAASSVLGMLLRPGLPLAQLVFNPILLEFGFGILVCLTWRRGVPDWGAAVALIMGLALLLGPRLFAPDLIFSPEATHVIDGSLSLRRASSWGLPWALILLGALSSKRPASARDPLVAIGDASYAMYLVHTILVAAVAKYLLVPGLDPALLIGSVLAGSVALGLATHRWLERPLTRALSHRKAISKLSKFPHYSPRCSMRAKQAGTE